MPCKGFKSMCPTTHCYLRSASMHCSSINLLSPHSEFTLQLLRSYTNTNTEQSFGSRIRVHSTLYTFIEGSHSYKTINDDHFGKISRTLPSKGSSGIYIIKVLLKLSSIWIFISAIGYILTLSDKWIGNTSLFSQSKVKIMNHKNISVGYKLLSHFASSTKENPRGTKSFKTVSMIECNIVVKFCGTRSQLISRCFVNNFISSSKGRHNLYVNLQFSQHIYYVTTSQRVMSIYFSTKPFGKGQAEASLWLLLSGMSTGPVLDLHDEDYNLASDVEDIIIDPSESDSEQESSRTLEEDITEISKSAAKLDIVNAGIVTEDNNLGVANTNVLKQRVNKIAKSLELDITEISNFTTKIEAGSSSTPVVYKRQREASEEDNIQNVNQKSKGPPTKKVKKVTMAPPNPDETIQQPSKQLVRLVPDLENIHLFSKAHLEIIHSSVLKALKACKDPNVKFDFCKPDRGQYKFVCPNEEAKAFAMNIVEHLENLWADSKIKAVDHGDVPKMIRATVTFNNPPPEILEFFEDIDFKNESIDTNDWRVYTKKKIQGNKTVVFIGVDEKSVEDLKAIGSRPYFENGRTKISIDNTNQNK